MLSTVVLMALSARVAAHAGVSPALGVTGTFTKADVQRVVAGSDCGSTNVAATIDSSTAVAADPTTGSFSVTGSSFDPGSDGSTSVTALVDTTGTGKSFTGTVDVTTNGNAVQTASTSTQPIVAALPAGTKCTGGAAGNLCLVAFKTTAGFQNCVVVSQGAASNAAAGTAAAAAETADAAGTVVAGAPAASGTAVAGAPATGAKKVKKVKTAAAKAAAKAAKKAAKAAKKAGAATAPAAAAATPAAASSKRAVGSRAARAARAGVFA